MAESQHQQQGPDRAGMPTGYDIRQAREAYHLTQDALARRLDVTARTVGNWERGSTTSRNRVGALCDVLGLTAGRRTGLLSEATDAELVAELGRRLETP